MKELEAVRRTLEDRLRVLTERLEEIDDDLTEHEEGDVDERASEIAGDEVLEGLGNTGLREMEQIRAALKRIELGTYCRCTKCGEPIDARRIAAVPHTARCISCEAAGLPTR